MYTVILSDDAIRQLKKLNSTTRERIIATLERIRIRPEQHVERLVGREGYKLRIGDYRAIIDIKHEVIQILVIMIGHRKKVYK